MTEPRYKLIEPTGSYKYFDIIDTQSDIEENFVMISISIHTPEAKFLAVKITALLNKEGGVL